MYKNPKPEPEEYVLQVPQLHTNRSKDSVVQDSKEIIEFVKKQFYHALSDLEHLISTVHQKKN